MSGSILGPSGRPMVELGGERAWLQRVKGDIVCSFQWLQLDELDPDAPIPCMCLFPTVRRMETGAYVIPQRNAYAYATNRGGPTPALLASAFQAAQDLGFFPDKTTVTRVMDIVLEGLPDLIRMPSEQPHSLDVARRRLGIEASVTINGKTYREDVL